MVNHVSEVWFTRYVAYIVNQVYQKWLTRYVRYDYLGISGIMVDKVYQAWFTCILRKTIEGY